MARAVTMYEAKDHSIHETLQEAENRDIQNELRNDLVEARGLAKYYRDAYVKSLDDMDSWGTIAEQTKLPWEK